MMQPQDIATRVREELSASAQVRHVSLVDIKVDRAGIVTLEGEIDTIEEKVAASDIARGVEGVTEVVNNLKVSTPEIDQL